MYLVSFHDGSTYTNPWTTVSVSDSKSLFNLLFILEKCPDCKSYSIVGTEGKINCLKGTFGWGSLSKFNKEV